MKCSPATRHLTSRITGKLLYCNSEEVAAMNIILVEDDEIYAEFIKKALSENRDYKITSFTTAEDGLKAINGMLPDVMIIDYNLPGMNGIDLYEKIKHRITNDQKVIMLSALDDGNMVLSFIQKGVRDYVIKDENVIESLRAILEEKEDDYLFN
jgi:DNA-binding NarL/FixJ family response regulator